MFYCILKESTKDAADVSWKLFSFNFKCTNVELTFTIPAKVNPLSLIEQEERSIY